MNKTNFIISNRNRRYKVNESQFKNIVKESVKKLIREVGEKHRFGKGAYGLAMDAAKKARSLGRHDQADNLTSHAARYFNQDYGTDGFEMDKYGQLNHTGDLGRQTMYRPASKIRHMEKNTGYLGGRQALDDANRGNERIRRAASTAKAYPRKRMTGGLDAIDTVDSQLNTESINRIVKESVNKVLKEDKSYAEIMFDEYGFADKLYDEFGIEDVEIDENGKITVWDYLTDKTYNAVADYEIEPYSTGKQSARNPYAEEEELDAVYDFETPYQEISQQIRMDRGI